MHPVYETKFNIDWIGRDLTIMYLGLILDHLVKQWSSLAQCAVSHNRLLVCDVHSQILEEKNSNQVDKILTTPTGRSRIPATGRRLIFTKPMGGFKELARSRSAPSSPMSGPARCRRRRQRSAQSRTS